MNKLYPYILLVFLTSMSSCKTTTAIGEKVEVVTDSKSTNGVLYVKSFVLCSKRNDVYKTAKSNALEKVLFTGIPGSSVSYPMISKLDTRSRHPKYFDDLLMDEIRMNQFVEATSYNPQDFVKKGDLFYVGVKCMVKYKALRRDLEQNGIIEKFGI